MPSENYYNNPIAVPLQANEVSPSFRQRASDAASRVPGRAMSAYNQMLPQHQKEMQRKLGNLQKSAPKLAKNLAKGKPSALVGLAGNMLRKIDWSQDWMFIPFLASFALLKDIFDIAFAAVGTATSLIPVLGQATVAVGMIVTFVGEILLLILTVTVLVLTGSSLKNRGMAKYFIGLSVTFISEALPGIGWLPLAFVEVFILYGFVLFDRAFEQPAAQASQSQAPSAPAYAAADSYYRDEKAAA